MSQIDHSDFSDHILSLKDKKDGISPSPIYLIHGDEFICKSVFEGIVDALMPDSEKRAGVETFDGDPASLADALERVNTYSLLSGGKIVAVLDSRIFHGKKDAESVMEKAAGAYQNKEMDKAAKYLLGAMALLGLASEALGQPETVKSLQGAMAEDGDTGWLTEVIEFSTQKGLSVPEGQGDEQVVVNAVTKGFPRGNHLIITTDTVDKRRKLYTCIKDVGIVVDCSVPQGDRRADRQAREQILDQKLREKMSTAGKTLERGAAQRLIELTGGQVRNLFNSIDKLIDYVGDRKKITTDDVADVVKRTKKDPIYAFTDALTDKNLEKTLFYMKSLVEDPDFGHPLQLLAAAANQVRKLLVVKGFLSSNPQHRWHAGCTYPVFQRECIPAIVAHDEQLVSRVQQWPVPGRAAETQKGRAAAGKKRAAAANLVIARNPKSAYPVYQLFRKSEGFTQDALIASLMKLQEADIRMKSSGQDPRVVLEQVVFFICQ